MIGDSLRALTRRWPPFSRFALAATLLIVACDHRTSMPDATHPALVVRAALGWRARQVERQSTAPVRFREASYSQVLLTDDPVQLVYADPAHGFTLPPGRYVRVIQDAGRVSAVTAAPQLDALPRAGARALLFELAARLEAAGWRRTPDDRGPLATSVDRALDIAAQRTFGLTGVAVWHAPRSAAPWAALPPGALRYADSWDGLEARLSLNTIGPDTDSTASAMRFAVNLDIADENLRTGLSFMADARQVRLGAGEATLSDWDREPYEPFRPPSRLGAVPAVETSAPR